MTCYSVESVGDGYCYPICRYGTKKEAEDAVARLQTKNPNNKYVIKVIRTEY